MFRWIHSHIVILQSSEFLRSLPRDQVRFIIQPFSFTFSNDRKWFSASLEFNCEHCGLLSLWAVNFHVSSYVSGIFYEKKFGFNGLKATRIFGFFHVPLVGKKIPLFLLKVAGATLRAVNKVISEIIKRLSIVGGVRLYNCIVNANYSSTDPRRKRCWPTCCFSSCQYSIKLLRERSPATRYFDGRSRVALLHLVK